MSGKLGNGMWRTLAIGFAAVLFSGAQLCVGMLYGAVKENRDAIVRISSIQSTKIEVVSKEAALLTTSIASMSGMPDNIAKLAISLARVETDVGYMKKATANLEMAVADIRFALLSVVAGECRP